MVFSVFCSLVSGYSLQGSGFNVWLDRAHKDFCSFFARVYRAVSGTELARSCFSHRFLRQSLYGLGFRM